MNAEGNGLKSARETREVPGYRDTPIVAMTANAFAEYKAHCFEEGMSDYIVKLTLTPLTCLRPRCGP